LGGPEKRGNVRGRRGPRLGKIFDEAPERPNIETHEKPWGDPYLPGVPVSRGVRALYGRENTAAGVDSRW